MFFPTISFKFCTFARLCSANEGAVKYFFLTTMLKNSSSPSLSSHHLSHLLWTHSIRSMSFLCWGPRAGCSTSGGVSQKWTTTIEIWVCPSPYSSMHVSKPILAFIHQKLLKPNECLSILFSGP